MGVKKKRRISEKPKPGNSKRASKIFFFFYFVPHNSAIYSYCTWGPPMITSVRCRWNGRLTCDIKLMTYKQNERNE